MSITRVRYRERQRLTVADLRTEQDYRLGIAGRHHISHHRGGVVRGLHIVEQANQTWTLMPGVAIDGYGREILVPSPVDLPIDDPEACWFVLLYYCEYPEQVLPDRACEDDPAPRTGHRFRVVLAEDFSPRREMPPDFDRAHAAGSLRDLPSWPILAARVGKGCDGAAEGEGKIIDYSETRYVGHRASMICSPTGQAMFQLGLSSRSDIYHMLLSTVHDGNTLSRRLGSDRDGAVHIWRPLFISGAEAVGEIALSGDKTLLVSTAMPAGVGARVLLQGRLNASATILSISLVDLGVTRPKRIENDIELPKGQPLPGEVVLGKLGSCHLI